MDPRSNISKQASYLATFLILDLQEHAFRTVRKTRLFGAGSAGAKKCVLRTDIKMFSLKSKMKPVVKYGVY